MIPVISPLIELGRRLGDKKANKRKIKELQEVDQKSVLDLVSSKKQTQAKILLLQTELYLKNESGAEPQELSKLQKDIVNLMKKDMEDRKEELSKKNATMLEIAKLMVTIQNLSRIVSDDLNKVKIETNLNTTKNNIFKEYIQKEFNDLKSKVDSNLQKINNDVSSINAKLNKLNQISAKNSRNLTIFMGVMAVLIITLLIAYFLK